MREGRFRKPSIDIVDIAANNSVEDVNNVLPLGRKKKALYIFMSVNAFSKSRCLAATLPSIESAN